MTRGAAREQGDNVRCRAALRSHLGVKGRCVCTVNKREEVKKEVDGVKRRAASVHGNRAHTPNYWSTLVFQLQFKVTCRKDARHDVTQKKMASLSMALGSSQTYEL